MTRVIVFVAAFVATNLSIAAAERVLPEGSIDSLVYESDAIVRVEVGDAGKFNTIDGERPDNMVKILDVFKGSLKVGDTCRVAGLDEYHWAPGIANRSDSWRTLGKGDNAYLFLGRNGKTRQSVYPVANIDWVTIESGARLLVDQNVYSFDQIFRFSRLDLPYTSGYDAMTNVTFPGAQPESRQAFEDHFKQSERTIDRVNQLLAADPTPQTQNDIIAFLRSRSAPTNGGVRGPDSLDSMLAERLATMARPAVLVALVDGGLQEKFELNEGLKTQEGRTYLIERMGDPKETREHRLWFARILCDSVSHYLKDVSELNPEQAKTAHLDFATSLAHLIAENLRTEVCEPLLKGILDLGTVGHPTHGPFEEDLDEAAFVLSEIYPKATAADKVNIAGTLLHLSPYRYEELLPHVGPLASVVQLNGVADDMLKHRELRLYCCFCTLPQEASQLKLVLHPERGKEIEIAIAKPDVGIAADVHLGTISFSYSYTAEITATIPHGVFGKYSVFLRDYLDNRPNGDGAGFDIDIPKK